MAKALFIAVGSNLTDCWGRAPLDICRDATRAVAARAGLRLERVSHWYRTAPIPVSDQPDYVNGVMRLTGPGDPAAVLEALHQIEAEAGRLRNVPNAARTLDLDLLAVDDLVLPGPGLVLPHPRLHQRAFVLHPFADIAPGWRHPILGQTVEALRDRLAGQEIEQLPDSAEDLLLRP